MLVYSYGNCWQRMIVYDGMVLTFLFYIRANRTQFANVSLHSITDDDAAEVLALPALEGYGDEGKSDTLRRKRMYGLTCSPCT